MGTSCWVQRVPIYMGKDSWSVRNLKFSLKMSFLIVVTKKLSVRLCIKFGRLLRILTLKWIMNLSPMIQYWSESPSHGHSKSVLRMALIFSYQKLYAILSECQPSQRSAGFATGFVAGFCAGFTAWKQAWFVAGFFYYWPLDLPLDLSLDFVLDLALENRLDFVLDFALVES